MTSRPAGPRGGPCRVQGGRLGWPFGRGPRLPLAPACPGEHAARAVFRGWSEGRGLRRQGFRGPEDRLPFLLQVRNCRRSPAFRQQRVGVSQRDAGSYAGGPHVGKWVPKHLRSRALLGDGASVTRGGPLVQKEALVSSRRLPRVTGVSSPAPGADRARSPSVGVPGCRLLVVGPRGHRVLPNSGLQTVRSVPRTMFSDMCTESAVPCVGSAADLHAAQKCRVTYFQCFLPRLSNNQVRGPARRLLDAPPASLRLLACVVVRGP